MNKFWKMLMKVEFFNAILGWLMFSILAKVALSVIFEIVNFSLFNELSTEAQIIVSLIVGYCFFYPYWDKRNRS